MSVSAGLDVSIEDRLGLIGVVLGEAMDRVDRLRVDRLNLIEEAFAGGLNRPAIARALRISTQRLDQLRKGV